MYYYLGEIERSVDLQRRAVEEMPRSVSTWLNLGDALRFSLQPDESVAAYQKAAELAAEHLAVSPNASDTLYRYAWAVAGAGDIDEAQMLIQRSLSLAPESPYGLYYDGLIKNSRGDSADAVDALRLAVKNGYPATLLAADPLLTNLRSESEFSALADNTVR